MRKLLSAVITSALLSGGAIAHTEPTYYQSFWDSWTYAIGTGVGFQWANHRGSMSYTTGGVTTTASSIYKPTNGNIEIYGRTYYTRWAVPVFIHLGATLTPHSNKTGFAKDFFTGGSLDTFLWQRQRWTTNLMVGLELLKFKKASFAFLFGGNYTSIWHEAKVLEAAPIVKRKKNNSFNGALGAEIRYNLVPMGRGGWDAILNYTANYIESDNFRFTSAATNNTYGFRGDSGWKQVISLKFQYRF